MTAPVSRVVCVIGFGELGRALTRAIAGAGHGGPRVTSGSLEALDGAARAQAVTAAGGLAVPSLADAVRDADLVLVCVPGTASTAVAARAAGALAPDALYVDLTSTSPAVKLRSAELITEVGGRFVDVAVLGAVAASGGRVPLLACGGGAVELAQVAPQLGLAVTPLDGPVGSAARVKLLRSVYLKGRDALIAEMMAAAEQFGLTDVVAQSIRGPGEEVTFPALATRVLDSLDRHSRRRADELKACAELLRSSGVEALATEGAEERLRCHASRHVTGTAR